MWFWSSLTSASHVRNPDPHLWSGDDSSVWCSGAWLTAQLGHIGRRPIAWLHLPCRADSGSKLCQRDSLALLPHSGGVHLCMSVWRRSFISIYTFTERNRGCKGTLQLLFDVMSHAPSWIVSRRYRPNRGPDREDWQESGKKVSLLNFVPNKDSVNVS